MRAAAHGGTVSTVSNQLEKATQMTSPKIRTVKRGGSRFYVHPVTGEQATGVTSVVGMLPKDFLKWWAAKMVAEEAYDNFGTLASFVVSGDRDAAVKWLKAAHQRNTGSAALRGNVVHEMTEAIDESGGMPARINRELLPYARGYLAFREETEAQILAVERTIWSQVHGYSGTLDRSILLPEAAFAGFDSLPAWYEGPKMPIIADVKTTRSGVHAEVALQMSAYATAEEALSFDEHGAATVEAWPEHASTGLVIHLRPDAWRLVPVSCGPDVFAVFQSLLKVFAFERGLKNDVILPDLAGATWADEDVIRLADVLAGLAK